MASEIFDDKSNHVIPFILSHLSSPNTPKDRPFFIGLNGVQGAGKTVLTSTLNSTLTSPPYSLSIVVFSLDDLYLPHSSQVSLAAANPDNPLLQHRGQPGTHDIPLLVSIFSDLRHNRRTQIPTYDKSRFSGQGDRAPESEWHTVNVDPANPVRVVLFEGWCVGFQPLTQRQLATAHSAAVSRLHDTTSYSHHQGQLAHHSLASVTAINDALRQYRQIWSYFNVFVHIDAADPMYVYKWRLEQEATTKHDKGVGMSDEQVKKFVDGYYPSYELYTDALRRGLFVDRENVKGSEPNIHAPAPLFVHRHPFNPPPTFWLSIPTRTLPSPYEVYHVS
ncbi:hypothetical protein DV737_g3093, partial [Chaetothyriales sp. CBS 132003]